MSKVVFLKGTAQEYAALTEKNKDTFYHTTDDNQLYLGDIKLSNANDLSEALTKIQTNAEEIFALSGKIGNLEDLTTTSKEDLVSAIIELKNSITTNQTNGAVTISTDETSEGAAKSYTIKQGTEVVGTIDIPKDMVVKSGRVIEVTASNDLGLDAGTFIELTLANAAEDKIYINVGTLVDLYVPKAEAAKIQVTIDPSTREIGANIVAGSITTEDLADKIITTEKIAEGSITLEKLSTSIKTSLEAADSAVKTIAESTTNGTILVDGKEVKIHGLGSAAYEPTTSFDAAGSADQALQDAKTYINGLLAWGAISTGDSGTTV